MIVRAQPIQILLAALSFITISDILEELHNPWVFHLVRSTMGRQDAVEHILWRVKLSLLSFSLFLSLPLPFVFDSINNLIQLYCVLVSTATHVFESIEHYRSHEIELLSNRNRCKPPLLFSECEHTVIWRTSPPTQIVDQLHC